MQEPTNFNDPNLEPNAEPVPEASPSPPRPSDDQWQAASRVGESILESDVERRTLKNRRFAKRSPAPYSKCRPKAALTSQFLNAAMVNNTELLEDMINKGFDPDTREQAFNRSALHIACSRGFTDAVRLLLEKGANPNIRDLNENTPLHLASCTENIAIIDLLLKYGTNVTLRDASGLIALEIAIGKLRLSDRIISKMQRLTKSDIHNHRNNVVRVCEMIFRVFKQQVRGGSLLYLDPSEAGHLQQRQLEELLEDLSDQLSRIRNRNIDFDAIVDQVENLNLRSEIDSDVNTLLSTLQKLSV
ncbi:ankyrin repeat domain-containing protein 54-like [Topomyia yanbarensis]|uniref:ankyrin repeat domain-containing protein 54-like n=1 Tax=Topomyia yanbarensis TaxID=2498891 RepID=UPI00273C99DD|nr:ankyrin repeat domain-containing protein 54-like [Topomyia yanbarensis]